MTRRREVACSSIHAMAVTKLNLEFVSNPRVAGQKRVKPPDVVPFFATEKVVEDDLRTRNELLPSFSAVCALNFSSCSTPE